MFQSNNSKHLCNKETPELSYSCRGNKTRLLLILKKSQPQTLFFHSSALFSLAYPVLYEILIFSPLHTNLIRAGSLVSSIFVAEVLIHLCIFCFSRHASSGFVYRGHVVAQRNGLHCFVYPTADALADFGRRRLRFPRWC